MLIRGGRRLRSGDDDGDLAERDGDAAERLGADAELPTRYRSPVNLRDEISDDGMELSWRNSGGRGIRGRFRYRVAKLPHVDTNPPTKRHMALIILGRRESLPALVPPNRK